MSFASTLQDIPGLVSHWRLDETSGTNAVDVEGTNAGTYVGTPTLDQPGLLLDDSDSAVTLNGTTQYISVADHASIKFTNLAPFSLGILFVPTTVDATARRLFSKENVAGAFGWDLLYNNAKVEFGRYNFGGGTNIAMNSALVVGRRYLIIATFDGTTQNLYINGALVATGNGSGTTITADTSLLYIGARGNDASRFAAGKIDEPFIYNVGLTAQQQADIAAAADNEGDFPRGGLATPGGLWRNPIL